MKSSFVFGVVTMLLLGLAVPAAAQTGGAIVRPEATVFDIGEGQVETINIVLENAQDAYGIDVRATFDPAVVEVVDSDPAREGIQLIPGGFPQPDFLVRNVADNEAGTLWYVTTQVSPTLPINGTGVVFSVQFRGKALGQQTALVIESVEIADRHGLKLAVQPQDGRLSVVPPKPPTPTAVVTATPMAAMSLTPAALIENTPAPAEPATASVNPPGASASSSSRGLLLGLAVGGGLGAVVLLGMAAVMLRRPQKRKPK